MVICNGPDQSTKPVPIIIYFLTTYFTFFSDYGCKLNGRVFFLPHGWAHGFHLVVGL